MDRVPGRCLLVTLLVLSVAPTAASAAERTGSGGRYVADELIVRFKPGVSGAERADARRDGGATVERALRVPRAQLLDLEAGQSVREAQMVFERDPRVEFAEPNYVVRAESNDPLFSQLWGLENLGGSGGLADADVDAPQAWAASLGGTVVVAVADTGVVLDHPDLAPRIVVGHDFLDDDSIPADLAVDAVAHGTHVAGTIAAVRDNAEGVAGVADEARIMPLRVLDEHGEGSTANIADAFTYAAANGARVVNASLGWTQNVMAVQTAISGAPNTLFVVAAGNDGRDNDVTPHYPCSYPQANVLCVAASDRSDARASFSNWGDTSVDIAAPGVDIASTHASFDLASQQGFEDPGPLPAGWTNVQDAGTETWAVSPTHKTAGAQGLAIQPAADSNTSAVTSLDLTGRHGCQMLFDLDVDMADPSDLFTIETSTSPGAWTPTFSRDTSTSQFFLFGADLPAGVEVDVRFRFDVGSTVGSRMAVLDDLRIYCSTDEYAVLDGTSMATPHVSGAAALVLAAEPGLSAADLKQRLLDSGDLSACWTDVTVSARRLNVARALGVVDGLGPGPTASGCSTGGANAAPPPSQPSPAPAPPPTTNTPPPAPSPGGGGDAAGVDRTAPTVGLAVIRTETLARVIRRGLRTGVRCSERCTVSARLYGRTAAGRAVLVGRSARVTSRRGRVTAVIRLSSRGRAFLRRGPRRQTLTLSVTAADGAGNGRKLRRRVSLRR